IGPARNRPEIVVAGYPQDLGETWRRDPQGELQVLARLADIAAENQPVVGMIRERGERLAIEREAEMNVTDRVQFHRRSWRLAWGWGADHPPDPAMSTIAI